MGRLVARFPDRGVLTACYEAGPTGYDLARLLRSLGARCDVVAPSLVPKAPGDRVKADPRDCRRLTRLHRAEDSGSLGGSGPAARGPAKRKGGLPPSHVRAAAPRVGTPERRSHSWLGPPSAAEEGESRPGGNSSLTASAEAERRPTASCVVGGIASKR